MSQKHILLADADAKTVEEFRQALGEQWVIKPVGTGAAALDELKSQPYDGLIASLYLPDVVAAQFLNKVRAKYPKTVRFIVASENDRERVVKEVLGAHQFLIRPFDSEGLRTTVERALAFDRWIDNDKLHKLVARMRSLPTVPALYLEILAALRSPDTTTEEVGEIIAKDMAITTKLLQVINSAYFGLPRTVTSPSEAVGLLGFETVKSMVMAVKLLNQYDRIKMGDFSVERLWQHSTTVAHNARQLVLLQTGERTLAEEAFAAGLMHDVGKAVLAGNFVEQYQGAQSLARKQQIPMWEVEKEIFGASHGEIGAYLLGLWGLPLGVLEAAALHHQPGRAANKVFTALSAVHVANVLQHEIEPDLDGEAPAKLDVEYLAEIGMLECVPAWREEILGPEHAGSPQDSEEVSQSSSVPGVSLTSAPPPGAVLSSSEECFVQGLEQTEPPAANTSVGPAEATVDPANDDPNGVDESQGSADSDLEAAIPQSDVELAEGEGEQLQVAGLPEPGFAAAEMAPAKSKQRWLAVCAIAVFGLLVVWFMLGRETRNQKPLVVRAQPLREAPATNASELLNTSSAPHSDNQGEARPQKLAETNTAVLPAGANPSISAPSPGPGAPADSSTQPAAQPQLIFPELKLQGIFFAKSNPSAIVNGILIHKNDLISGVRVMEIKPGSVTIEFQHQKKTLSLE